MRTRDRLLFLAPPAAFLLVFFFLPLLAFLGHALGPDAPWETARRLWRSGYHRERILFTLGQALASSLLTVAAATPLAYLLARCRFRAKRLIGAALLVPFVLPPLVVAMSFQALLGDRGLLGRLDALDQLGIPGAILLAHVFYNLGLAVRIIADFWERVPAPLLDAARTLGATRRATALRILVPLGLPAILSAAALVFLFSASSFGLILLLGAGEVGTLETLIYEEGSGFLPHYEAAALLGLLQLLLTLAALAVYSYTQRRTRATFRPRTEPPSLPLPPWGRAALASAVLFVTAPLTALAWSAFRYQDRFDAAAFRFLAQDSYPLGNYSSIDAIANSLAYALLAILLSLPLAYLLAKAGQRLPPGAAAWEAVALSPLGVSALLIGLGFLLAFDGTPFWDLRGTSLRIVLGHTLIVFPFVSRLLVPSLDAVEPALEETAKTLGAPARQRFLHLELPLLRPALVGAAIVGFATSLGEFGATLLLRRPETTTLPLAIYDGFSRPGEPYRAQAEALALILALLALLSFWGLDLARRGRGVDPS